MSHFHYTLSTTFVTIKNQEDPKETYNSLLQKYVSASGIVNYSGLKSQAASLNQYLDYKKSRH